MSGAAGGSSVVVEVLPRHRAVTVEVNANTSDGLTDNTDIVLSPLQSVIVGQIDAASRELSPSNATNIGTMSTTADVMTMQSVVTSSSSNAPRESSASINYTAAVVYEATRDPSVVISEAANVPADAIVEVEDTTDAVEIENDGFIGDVKSQYLIVNSDGTTSVGYGNLEGTSLAPGEPATKRYRIEGEDGQAYLLTLADDMPTSAEDLPQKTRSPRIFPSKASEGKGIEKRNQLLGSDISQAWFTTKDDKMILQNNGANWRQGQWTKAEIDMLQVNITEYCSKHNISDPTEIIFEMSKDGRKEFYRTVAKGLQRPLFSVYRRVTRMYDQKNHMGKYSHEEMMKLRELRHKHGNDWASIGQAMGRSASSVKDKCRLMKDTCNSGKWLPEEERRLASAVYELSGASPGENVVKGLCWQSVADQVITRSDKQCRTKWLNYLNWKERAGKDWTREDDISLILKVGSMGAKDDTEIDWNLMANQWDSVRSPQWLRGKWWSLKRHIPDYQLLPYDELLEYMKTFYLQNVRVKIKNPVNKGHVSRTSGVGSVKTSMVQQGGDILTCIPVAMVPGLSIGEDGLSCGDPALEAYEVLQQLPTSSGLQYIISQPGGGHQVIGATQLPEHIIVQTMPVSQKSDGSSNGSPAHVVITDPSATDCLSAVTGVVTLEGGDLGATMHLTETHQGLEVFTTDTGMSHNPPLSDDSAFDTHVHSHIGDGGHLGMHIKVEDQSPVLVTPAFGQPCRSDGQLMTSFSDPMLNSDSNNIIESASDMEGDKSHHDDLGVNLE